jgi:hypothetical protein
MKIGISLILCTVAFFGFSQNDFRPGYIVGGKGDTVRGYVAYQSEKLNFRGCTFKPEKRSEEITYTSEQILGFGYVQGKSYRSISLPKNHPTQGRVFVKLLVQSEVSLYKFNEYYLIKNRDSLFTLPLLTEVEYGRTEDFVKIKDNRYIGILNLIVGDCQLNANTTTYSEPAISNLISEYNACKGYNVVKNKVPLGKLSVTGYGGYVQSSLVFDNLKHIPFSPSTTVLVGVGAEVSLPRFFDKFFVTMDMQYANSFYQGYRERVANGNLVREDILMDVSYLKIPLGIKYNFRSDESSPYLRLGASWSKTYPSEIRTVEEREFAGEVFTDIIEGGYDIKNPKSTWVSIGYTKAMAGRLKLFGEFRYELSEGFMGTAVVNDSSMKNSSVLMGIKF